MFKRALLVFALSYSVAIGAEGLPSEASVKDLLEVMQSRRMADTVMTQIDAVMKNAIQQVTKEQIISPRIQKEIDNQQAELLKIMKEELNFDKLPPMYVRVYQKSLTQPEIDGMIAFYKTPTGQAVIQKMPLVLQNTMVEMQSVTAPMIQRIQKMQQDLVAQIRKEKAGG